MSDMQNWGEGPFIEYLKSRFSSGNSAFGIGDDCAVISEGNGENWLVTTDALVEGVHFLKDQISPRDLGYKTVAVNVSDIAAMGGRPKYAFLSIALPKTIDRSWVYEVVDGIKEACDKWGIFLLGGDTVGSKRDIFLNLTLIGSSTKDHIKYRSQAQFGDVICVSGFLGDSGGGLKALQEQSAKTAAVQDLINAHFRPNPSPSQGMWLANHPEVHAMMDVSDGLNCDLERLIKQSAKGAVVELSKIPMSKSLRQASQECGWDAFELALTGGEDYCLLLTVSQEAFNELQHSFQETFNAALHAIGNITDHLGILAYQSHGQNIQTNYRNYDPFL